MNPYPLKEVLDANKIPPAIAQELLDHFRVLASLSFWGDRWRC
jgi:hypothetical protein